MKVLVTGGAKSGKSSYAEKLAVSFGSPRVYIATLSDTGSESARRIDLHRKARAGKGFATVECSCGLDVCELATSAQPAIPRQTSIESVLLEDLPNIVANEMFTADGRVIARDEVYRTVLASVLNLESQARNVVVVANEIGCDGCDYAELTSDYVELMGQLCQRFADWADLVVEVVAGCPVALKGELL